MRHLNSVFRQLPSSAARYRWAGVLWLIFVTASTLTRVAVLVQSQLITTGRPILLFEAFAVGAVYDALVALWLVAPFMVYLTLARPARFGRRAQCAWRRTAVAMSIAIALFTAAAELLFFDEFNGRFNFVAVDYLVYPTEVTTNIWQSYHVAWSLTGIALVVALVMWALRPLLRRLDESVGPRPRWRLVTAGGFALVLGALTRVASPTLAHVSDDRVVNELAANGYYTFWRSLLGKDAPYDGLYATLPDSVLYPTLSRLLGPGDSPRDAWTTRRTIPSAAPPRRLNVVVVLEESFGSSFVGALHPTDSMSLTPAFDSLAAQGTLLTHAYSTGNRAIRALEATTSSLPPLPGISIVRRPQSVDLFTLPNVLRAHGYATEFVYGGRAMFDGMATYMRNNGIERVVEQRDFPSGTFTTAWGVADEAIFDKALTEMDSLHATGRPFYSLVLTVSNHRPYTYPNGRIAQNPAEKRRTNVVRYADWALGRFMRDARTHAFFDSTVFVIMGDHGARVYGAAEIPLPSYEVPVLFYAPGIVHAGVRLNTLASSLDVPPTVLGVLGLSYESKFFGQDVFHTDSASGHALMTHNAELAFMRGTRMVVLGPRSATTVYAVDAAGTLSLIPTPSASDRTMLDDAIAYFAGADHLYRSGRYGFDDPPTAHVPRVAALVHRSRRNMLTCLTILLVMSGVDSVGLPADTRTIGVMDSTRHATLDSVPAIAGPTVSRSRVAVPTNLTHHRPTNVEDDSVVAQRRRAVEHSDWYYKRLAIHKTASFATVPLFVAEYIVGDRLFDEDEPSGTLKSTHQALASGIGVLFGANTITGGWNLWESRHEPEGRARRFTHAALMLASDVGFVATASLAPEGENERDDSDGRNRHRTVAITSMGVSLASYLMMYLWK